MSNLPQQSTAALFSCSEWESSVRTISSVFSPDPQQTSTQTLISSSPTNNLRSSLERVPCREKRASSDAGRTVGSCIAHVRRRVRVILSTRREISPCGTSWVVSVVL